MGVIKSVGFRIITADLNISDARETTIATKVKE